MYSVYPSPKIPGPFKIRVQEISNNLVENPGNNFLAYCRIAVPDQPSDSPRTYMFSMDHSGRQNFDQFYGGQFSPYWLPRRHFQSSQPAVLVVQVPVPVTLKNNKFDQPNVIHNSKSKATLTRDRMQRFCDNKNMCSALPIAHLDDTQMKEVIRVQSDFQPNSRKSKLKSASKRIRDLKASFNLLNSTIQLLY